MREKKQQTTKVYIYTRVSTAMQVDGYSLDAQKEEIMKFVQYKNMQVCGEYTDEGRSGKNIQGRPGFQQMLDDIVDKKDGVDFVICYKLSRFGRNTADILNSLKLMNRYGVNLICIKENIDSSLDSGKMMISILGAMAEIERDNISVQTMAGRREKARQGGWNGAKAPYGYTLQDGKLLIKPDEAEQVKIIFDKYVHTDKGLAGVAKWMNDHGYQKNITTHNGLGVFTRDFIDDIIKNHAYIGKIAYGKRKTVLKEGTEEYHKIETNEFSVYEGKHEAIIPMDIWDEAQKKRKEAALLNESLDADHKYVYSGLLKCPLCGKSLYGIPMRSGKRKDGSHYPTYYAYACRSKLHVNGINCNFGQISCKKIDQEMYEIVKQIITFENFADVLTDLVRGQIDSTEINQELDTAIKAQRQALALQRKLESEIDALDATDRNYDRKYESLNRRLDDAFDKIEKAELRVADCEARLESVKRQNLSVEGVAKAIKLFDKFYDKMTDTEKKKFVQTFIEKIDLYPDKNKRDGYLIRSVKLKFPVSYEGKVVYELSPPFQTTDETVVKLCRENVDGYIEARLDTEMLEDRAGSATYKEIKEH